MADHYFFTPSLHTEGTLDGVRITVTEPSDKIKAAWPEGTVEIDAPTDLRQVPVYDADTSTVTWTDPGYTTDELKAALADYRYSVETGGTTVTIDTVSYTIATDRESQALIDGAMLGCELSGTLPGPWHLPDGTYLTLDADGVGAIYTAKNTHVTACRDAEPEVSTLIDAGSLLTPDAVTSTFDTEFATLTGAAG